MRRNTDCEEAIVRKDAAVADGLDECARRLWASGGMSRDWVCGRRPDDCACAIQNEFQGGMELWS